MRLLCAGVTPKAAGDQMNPTVDRRTVHYYLRRAKDKLGALTTYQACYIYGTIHGK